VKEVRQRVDAGNVKTIIMGYVSNAQRKAVHASKADGGKGNPNKMLQKMSPALAKISASCKAQAKKKFKVWPSAYASGWGVRCTRGDFKKK